MRPLLFESSIFIPTLMESSAYRFKRSILQWKVPKKFPTIYFNSFLSSYPSTLQPIMSTLWQTEWVEFYPKIFQPHQALSFSSYIKTQHTYMLPFILQKWEEVGVAGAPGGDPGGPGGGRGPSEEIELFIRELSAGIGGYSRSAVLGEPPSDHEFKDEIRAWFDKALRDERVPPKFGRQLRNQNYVQDKLGTALPEKAAKDLVNLVIKLGLAAKEGDTFETRRAHQKYMVDTIDPFLDGGSSYAPWLMHWLGVFWQEPLILWNPMSVWNEPRSATERISVLLERAGIEFEKKDEDTED